VISHSSKVLSNGLTGALIVGFTKDGRPSILEEVVRLLAVEREHGEDVGGGHAISVELDTVAWNSLLLVRHSLNRIRNAQDAFLCSSKYASVRRVWVGNELNLCVGSHWMSHLQPIDWHAVTYGVVGKIHIVIEEACELVTNEEIFTLDVAANVPPDDHRLANG